LIHNRICVSPVSVRIVFILDVPPLALEVHGCRLEQFAERDSLAVRADGHRLILVTPPKLNLGITFVAVVGVEGHAYATFLYAVAGLPF